MSSSKKVWFISGVHHKLEKSIALDALGRGDIVIGTTSDGLSNIELPDGGGKFYALQMNPNDSNQVYSAIEKAYAVQWRIDVVVDSSDSLSVLELMLPILRDQRAGHILKICSPQGTHSLESLVRELNQFNVDVTNIDAGYSATKIVDVAHSRSANFVGV